MEKAGVSRTIERECVTTFNIDVNNARKEKIRRGSEKGKNEQKKKDDEQRERVKLLELEIMSKRIKPTSKEAREIALYRASICREE